MKYILNIQSISDIITNSSSEVFMIFTKEGINTFKEIVSTLIGEDFDNVFDLELELRDYDEDMEEYLKSGSNLSYEEWCLEHDSEFDYYDTPMVRGIIVTAKNPKDEKKAIGLNRIYGLFESIELDC